MNEENINYEELAELVKMEMMKSHNVKDVIADKEEENKLVKNSFSNLWQLYNAVDEERVKSIKEYNKVIVKILVKNFLVMVIRNDVYFEIEDLVKFIKVNIRNLKDEKELLIMIKDAIRELERLLAVDCNLDLAVLLASIHNKNIAINESVFANVISCLSRTRGIRTQIPAKYDEKIEECNYRIDELIVKLGLKK